MTEQSAEEFLPIKDFEKYQISNKGNVKGFRGNMSIYIISGYPSVKLRRMEDGKSKRSGKLVHRLVAEAFIDNPKNLPIVNHKDGNKTNNHVDNLEWCTYQHNTIHAHNNGMIKKWERKVIQHDLDGNLVGMYDSISEAAEKTNLTVYGISKACRGGLKTSGGYVWKYIDNKDEQEIPDVENSEDWARVEGFDNYFISKKGEVFSLKRKKFMQPQKATYPRVKLFKDNKPHILYIHTLVAKTFIPRVEGKSLVNHIDGDKNNYHVDNLEWCTCKENSQHAVDTGLCPKPKGKRVVQFTESHEKIAEFDTLKEAAAATGAHPDTITLVCNGKRQRSGGFRWKWAGMCDDVDVTI